MKNQLIDEAKPRRYDGHMKKAVAPDTEEITVDLLEICPSCGRSDVLKINLIVGWDICKPSHRWCSGYGCTYAKDLLNG